MQPATAADTMSVHTAASRQTVSGALAGAVSTLVFTAIHDIFISDIWFSLIPMLVAGAICGALVSWSYARLANRLTLRGWLTYNLIYLAMFVMMGITSELVFEPVTTMAAVIAANARPDELIAQALPITAISTLSMALLIGRIYSASWTNFAVVLLTCSVLMMLLGINVTPIGLVDIPAGSLGIILELFGLIAALNLAYALLFIMLERRAIFDSSATVRHISTEG